MFTKTNIDRVLELFFKNPNTKIHLREIARRTKLSVGGVQKILKNLLNLKLITKIETKITTDYFANVENPDFKNLKLVFNLYIITSLGLIDYIADKYKPEVIVLFGSFARGEDNENSDIDIAVVSNKTQNLDFDKYNLKLSREINITHVDLKSASNEFKNNLINGIVVYGYLRLFK